MPNTSFGEITINIDVRGGIPASEIEKRIAKPVEEAVGSVSHLKNVLSISKEGNSTIILEFEPGTNMDFAALEVREKFNRIKNKLPSEIEKPVIAKYEYMDVPILIIAVTSTKRSPEELRKIVDERVKNRIQRIEGVARVEVGGGREGKIIIEVDQNKLASYGIPINRVVDIINVNNANLLAGEIKRVKDKYLVRTIGELESLADIENLAVASTKEGSVIRIKDIAQVKDSYLDPVDFARLNSQPVVSIYVQKETLANTVKISQLIQKELKNLKPNLEKDVNITITSNQAETIQQAIGQVKSSLLYGAALATIVLIFFLKDTRSVFIIASSIPISVFLTFYLMFAFNLTLNVMSLSGLALGIGMLVDNAIVVLDNIFKKREKLLLANTPLGPQTPKEAAIDGAEEMFLAIVASTLTTIIVFLPMVFINPEIRMLYSSIALTITFSLLASLLAALTLVPMLASRMKLKTAKTAPEPEELTPEPVTESLRDYLQPIAGATKEEKIPFKLKLQNLYKNAISFSLKFRYILITLVLIILALALTQASKLEKEFIGIAEQNKFTVFVELPTGTKIEVSDKIVAGVEKILVANPYVKSATSKIEPWSSKIYVELVALSKRKKSTQDIIESLRPLTKQFGSAFIYFEEPEEVGTKEILIELYGYDYEILKNLAIQIAQRMQGIPKFTDTKIRMREGRPEMQVIIDKRQASMLGLSVEDISLTLHTQMRGLVATRFRGQGEPIIQIKKEKSLAFENMPEDKALPLEQFSKTISSQEGKEVESIVRMEERFRKTFQDLRRISFVSGQGEIVYLSQVAKFKFDIGPSEIWRKNKLRMIQVSANTGGTALGSAAENVKYALKDLKFPKDYFWQIGGNYDKMLRNQNELRLALLLSLALVYMILASLFESFAEPFIILFTVPLAAIGVITALRITHKPVGIGVLIGAIMLGGIVVNNAIILIDRINFLKKRPKDFNLTGGIQETLVTASVDRLRPIMMTSLTTILGLVPMALDKSESSNLWSPLAITAIGGLTVSTFLTLFLIPSIYLIFKDFGMLKK